MARSFIIRHCRTPADFLSPVGPFLVPTRCYDFKRSDAEVIGDEEKAILWRSLERIPENYREPLVLFYREHQSIEAVAQDLGLSEDAVKQRLSRGRKLLQEQFLAFVAGALRQTGPGKAFTLGVIAALPLLATTAKAATVGTALAKHGGVAAKTTGFVGFLQATANFVTSMICWFAAALPLGGYIGYKMGGDRQANERARRSVATFWRIMGISMLAFFCLSPLVMLILIKAARLSSAKYLVVLGFWLNVCLPVFLFGVVPLAVAIWIWQRRRPCVPEASIGAGGSRQSPKSVTVWAVLAMTVALVYLGFFCWLSTLASSAHFPSPRYVSTSEVQRLIADPQLRKFRLKLVQSATGFRTLSGDVLENGKMNPFVAPAEKSTMALLAEKGVSYESNIETRDSPRFQVTHAGWWCERLLNPFCCFLLAAGAVTLLQGSHNRQPETLSINGLRIERRVDKTFAVLAACGMATVAVFQGVTTDWKVRTLAASQIPAVVAQHKNARFEVFEYYDGSRKLWISDLRHPDFIAPANEFTLGELTRQGVNCQTYVVGTSGFPEPGKSIAALSIFVLTAGAGTLLLWAVRSRSASPSRSQGSI